MPTVLDTQNRHRIRVDTNAHAHVRVHAWKMQRPSMPAATVRVRQHPSSKHPQTVQVPPAAKIRHFPQAASNRNNIQRLTSRRIILLGAAAAGASLLPVVRASFENREKLWQVHNWGDGNLHAMSLSGSGSENDLSKQELLTRQLRREGLIKTPRVTSAFARVDRLAYCCDTQPEGSAYVDAPQPIGYGQTISAPHMHAMCLELLESRLQPGARVLDVGSGSGFLTAVMAQLVAPGGHVIGIEKVEPLAARSIKSLEADQPRLMNEEVITILAGNALGDILLNDLQYDAIHVGAAAASMPEILKEKLANGGRMVIPVDIPGGFMQVLTQVDKSADGKTFETKELMGVGYVPLLPPDS